jgi:hypothetical protein
MYCSYYFYWFSRERIVRFGENNKNNVVLLLIISHFVKPLTRVTPQEAVSGKNRRLYHGG